MNKDIGTSSLEDIVYNYLNLPQTITVRTTGGAVKGTITYTYDAAGSKIKKEVTETGQPLKTTLYLGGSVYQEDTLQFIAHEEGRIRYSTPSGAIPAKFEYDYFLKDHLGNTRMVLTEEIKSDPYPPLGFEGTTGSQQVNEQNTYWENNNGQSINVTGVRTARPSGFGSTGTNGIYVRLVRKSTTSIGATKFLKVMAGDRIHARVDYYYSATNTDNSSATPFTTFANSLTGIFTNTSTAGGLIKGEASTISSQLQSNGTFTSLLNTAPSTSGANQAPKAYMNILFFDDQFKFDATNSVVVKVAYTSSAATLSREFSNAITANKSGYVYVYFTNESDALVYFDNFIVTHERGRMLEETHYGVWGNTLAGISGVALNFGKSNKYKYNKGSELQNKEFSDGAGLELYATYFRSLDPQLGRWWQIDPKPDYAQSLYSAMNNNPISINDPLGDTAYSRSKEGNQVILDRVSQGLKLKKGQVNPISINERTGLISLNKKAFKSLNSSQKSILRPLAGMIKDKKHEFGINIVNKDAPINPLPKGALEITTEEGKKYTSFTAEFYGGGVTNQPKFLNYRNRITTEIFLQKEDNEQTVSDVNGKDIANPNHVVMFHELGHAYYRDVLRVGASQGCKAVDCENEVRAYNGLPQRFATDPIHKEQ